MNSKPLFITGTTGIAGSFAVSELNRRDFNLRVMTRKSNDLDTSNLNTYVAGDLAQLNQLNQISKNNSGIIHYACASLGGKASKEIDIEAMKVLLNNWEQGPFVFISSLDVYGSPHTSNIIHEDYPLSGHMNDYAAGKIACEELLIEHAKQKGRTDYTIFRAPWIFSPSAVSKNHIQRRFLDIFKNEIILPGATQAEWEKYVDSCVDARDLAWLVAEAYATPLSGAGNVVADVFNWHDFFTDLNSVTSSQRDIVHKPITEVPNFSAELFGQICTFSGKKINEFYKFSPRYQLKKTLSEAFFSPN